MEIVAIGLNHKTATVELRERLAFSRHRLTEAYAYLLKYPLIKEALILSTCNRVEIYGLTDDEVCGISSLKEFLSSYHKIKAGDFEDNLYFYSGKAAVSHLFEVACGLDSLVVGEAQILRQLKEAYFFAQTNKATGKFLHVLLQKSFHTAKQVRSHTKVGKGRVSISSIAVKMVEETLGSLAKKDILVLGAGKISELIVKYLVSKGVSTIVVSNRSFWRAEKLSKTFPAQVRAIKFDCLIDYINTIDIVISSTAAPHFVIRYEDINKIIKNRKARPLFLMDLAVPRDIDPKISGLEGVHLYDIDDLEKIAKNNTQLRQEEIRACKQIIQRQLNLFMDWFKWEKITTSFKEVESEVQAVGVC